MFSDCVRQPDEKSGSLRPSASRNAANRTQQQPALGSTLKLRQVRYLERIAWMPDERLPRQMIACSAKKCGPTKRDGRRTTQQSYRSTLEKANLCAPGKGGDLSQWIPNLRSANIGKTIDDGLGLLEGTYQKGRKARVFEH